MRWHTDMLPDDQLQEIDRWALAAPDSVLENCSMYENLPADTLALYNDLWIELGI